MELKQNQRARRVGRCAIACALVLRLLDLGWDPLVNFILDLETGRDVRFSSSLQVFSPDFVESPPPFWQEPALPSFAGEEVAVYYGVRKDPDIPALLEQPLEWDLTGETPRVLILHTHSTESYTRAGEDYAETSPWRTLDEGYNMVAMGELVATKLEEKGIAVIQDRSLYDHPSYNGSYVRSRKGARAVLEKEAGIQLVLDLHRDAAGEGGKQLRTRAEVQGRDSAQLMIVVGTNHEGYEENLALALKLHAQLERQAPGIMRPLQLRAQRFNQDLSPGALLVEIGAAGNTQAEAKVAAEELAKALIALAKGTAKESP